jgi:hypothetical protein
MVAIVFDGPGNIAVLDAVHASRGGAEHRFCGDNFEPQLRWVAEYEVRQSEAAPAPRETAA